MGTNEMSGQVLYTYKAAQLWFTVRIHGRKKLRNRFDSLFVTKNNLSSTKLWKKDLVSFLHTPEFNYKHPQNARRKHTPSEYFKLQIFWTTERRRVLNSSTFIASQ
jgi:hypothetical protein